MLYLWTSIRRNDIRIQGDHTTEESLHRLIIEKKLLVGYAGNMDAEWEDFKEVVEAVSLEVLGTRPRRIKEQHLYQNTQDLIIQR